MYDVRMTRSEDATVRLVERTAMVNSYGSELMVSLHTNASSSPEVRGCEVYYSRNGEWGTRYHDAAKGYAQAVQDGIIKLTGLQDRGTKTWLVNNPGSPIHGMDYLHMIRHSKCPALLVESGFHSNRQDEALLKTPDFRAKIAQGICNGIKAAFRGRVITLDPGHGGAFRANVGPTGYVEADGVLDIGLRLRVMLRAAGYEVVDPVSGVYTVKAGDTLQNIADRFDRTVLALAQANNITNPDRIFVGQEIKIPAAEPDYLQQLRNELEQHKKATAAALAQVQEFKATGVQIHNLSKAFT